MRVLAIDDEPTFCDLLQTRLAQLGISDVETAYTGQEALEKASDTDNPFDCFLVDIRMIPMDGIEIVRGIRAIPHHMSTPIIMISSLTDKASIDAAFMAGANDYITKPLDTVELKIRLEMANSILEERAQTRLLHEHLLGQEAALYAPMNFEDEIILEDVQSSISMMSMENFLLKQGNIRLRQSCAIGFHMLNAESYFRMMDPTYYAVLMGEVSLAVSRTLDFCPHMLVCPGKGDVVALLLDHPNPDAQSLERNFQEEMTKLRLRLANLDMTVPTVRMGAPTHVSLWRMQCPTTLISKARDAAGQPPRHNDEIFMRDSA
ncbi:response regulator [Roseovarius sp. A21]|uniref:Response regulator n=1 Tax=Roseovarius bejariae TaxID=2576383 RepID=A0A844CSC8_9RHOB|nr:response regulator [Roseovarius bejariae]MRU16355.1 response regulator [Roseovarius bejariae]